MGFGFTAGCAGFEAELPATGIAARPAVGGPGRAMGPDRVKRGRAIVFASSPGEDSGAGSARLGKPPAEDCRADGGGAAASGPAGLFATMGRI